MEQQGKQRPWNQIVINGRMIERIAIHAVFIKPLQLRGDLNVDKFLRMAKPIALACVLTDCGKQRPVKDFVGGRFCELIVAGVGINRGDVGLPFGKLLARNNTCRFYLHQTNYDLAYRKIVCRFHARDLMAAEIHHFYKQRKKIFAVAVRNKDANVCRHARKAMLSKAIFFDTVKIRDNTLVGIGSEDLCH